MYKLVPKRTIRRIEDTSENEELRIMKLSLELAKKSDDELWKELVMLHLDDMRILNSEDGDQFMLTKIISYFLLFSTVMSVYFIQ